MKVSGVGRGSAASGKRTSKTGTSSDTFVRHLDEGKEAGGVELTEEAGAAEALASIGSLLSLQSVDPDAGGGRANRRLMLRAEEMLERLEEIRHGLLMGSIPKSILADLAQMVRSRREAGGHPHLIAILDEIELRAEVELAKLSKFANEPSAERT